MSSITRNSLKRSVQQLGKDRLLTDLQCIEIIKKTYFSKNLKKGGNFLQEASLWRITKFSHQIRCLVRHRPSQIRSATTRVHSELLQVNSLVLRIKPSSSQTPLALLKLNQIRSQAQKLKANSFSVVTIRATTQGLSLPSKAKIERHGATHSLPSLPTCRRM